MKKPITVFAQIEGDYPCDTFFPAIDTSVYRLWSAAAPQRHKGDRFSFLTYTRVTPAGGGEAVRLPPAVASRHEELQVGC